jgi:hypothetical protein
MSFPRHEKSIDPMWAGNAGTGVASAPALVGLDEFQLAIPWRDALQQGPPPLRQPGTGCCKLGSPVEPFVANGKVSLNRLFHPKGQVQTILRAVKRALR